MVVRILLTGASGFIGAHVAAQLAAAGASVRGLCRSEPPPEAELEEWVRGDVRDAGGVLRAAADTEAIVHTAALYSYRRQDATAMAAVNVEGTRNVVGAALRRGVRLLLTSSSATCGPVPGRTASERDAPPAWETRIPYKRTKLAAERLALSAGREGLDVVCVNPTTVLGEGDRQPTPSGRMVRDLVQGRIAGYLPGGGLNVVAVQDVARGHVLALEHGRAGQRYLLGGENLWMRDAFALACRAVGRPPPRLAIPWSLTYAGALATAGLGRALRREPTLLVLDEVKLARLPLFFTSEKARRELGYVSRPAEAALGEAARWFAAGHSGDQLARRGKHPGLERLVAILRQGAAQRGLQ